MAKLNNDIVKYIKELRDVQGLSYSVIEKATKVSRRTLCFLFKYNYDIEKTQKTLTELSYVYRKKKVEKEQRNAELRHKLYMIMKCGHTEREALHILEYICMNYDKNIEYHFPCRCTDNQECYICYLKKKRDKNNVE